MPGMLFPEPSLRGKLSEIGGLKGKLSIANLDSSGKEDYDGPYHVTPTAFQEQVLRTSGKVMTDDVTVDPISLHSVSNTANGITVYIAGGN